jgi:ureidoacrylate peracid hydrolase
MQTISFGPDIGKSVLIIVDMQNDFLHPDGNFSHIAAEHPEFKIDMPFLVGTIPNVKRLAGAFRAAERPVVYLAHVLKPDYSDAAFPYWRVGIEPGSGNRTHCVEGTWGAQIIDDLKPQEGEHLVVKKGFGGFSNTPLDTVLRNMGVTTCVVSGVTTCVCVSNTVRGGIEYNYRMIVVSDAVAEIDRATHETELKTMARIFADVKTTDEVIGMLGASDPEWVFRWLSTPSLEHDCLERDTHRIGAEFAGYCLGKRLDDSLRINASACSYLIHQRIAQHERSGIGSDIRDDLVQVQHCDLEVGKPGSLQRVLDLIDPMVAERHLIKLWRIVRKKSGEYIGDQATDRVVGCESQTLNRYRPLLTSTRCASRWPLSLSGKNMTPNWHTSTSKLVSGNGRAVASAG